MLLTALTPTEFPEKSYGLQNIGRVQVDRFRAEYNTLFAYINEKENDSPTGARLKEAGRLLGLIS